MALGTTTGMIERSKGESWERILKAGLAVGLVYMILSILALLSGLNFFSSFIPLNDLVLGANLIIALFLAVFLGIAVGIVETLFGAIFYEVVQTFQKEIR